MLALSWLACIGNDGPFVMEPDVATMAAPSFDSSSTCAMAELLGTAPEDGAVGVPTTILPLLEFDAFSCGLPFVSVTVLSSPAPAVFTPVAIGGALIRLEPDAPLAPGLWELGIEMDMGPLELGFEVDALAAPSTPPEPTDIQVEAERSCDPTLTSEVTVTVELGAASSAGVLRANVETENGSQASEHFELARPGTLVWDQTVLGGREVCVEVVVEDETGVVVFAPEPVCAASYEGCPAVDPDPDAGEERGCATAPAPLGSAWWLVAAALGLLTHRRRES